MISTTKAGKSIGILVLVAISLMGIIVSCTTLSTIPTAQATTTESMIGTPGADTYTFHLEKELGSGIIEGATWSPDGKSFALATSLQIDIYDAQTLELTNTLKTEQWNNSIVFSPNGKLLAAGGSDVIQVWEWETGNMKYSLIPSSVPIFVTEEPVFTFSQDGALLVSALSETVYVWDVTTGKLLDAYPGYGESIESVDIALDKNTILAAGARNIYLRNRVTRELLYPPIESTDDILLAHFTVDGKRIYSVHSESDYSSINVTNRSYVRSWDPSTGKMLDEHLVTRSRVDRSTMNFSRNLLVLGEEYGMVVWDTTLQKVAFSIQGKTAWLNDIAINPNGSQLISVGKNFANGNSVTQLWDLPAKQAIKTFDEYNLPPQAIAFNPGEKIVAISGTNQLIQIRDMNNGSLLYTLDGHGPLAFSPDGQTFAFTKGKANENDYVVLTDVKSRDLFSFTLPCPGTALAFSPDGEMIALGGSGCGLKLRKVKTGDLIRNLINDPDNVSFSFDDMAFSPDGEKIVFSGFDLAALDVQTGKILWQDDFGYGTHHVAFSPDGHYLASSGFGSFNQNDSVKVLDLASGQPTLTIETHQTQVNSMIFLSGGQRLMIVGNSAEIWDLWSKFPLIEADLFRDAPLKIQVSPSEQTLNAVEKNGSILQWSIEADPMLSAQVPSTPTLLPTITATPIVPNIELVPVAELGKGYGSDVFRSPDGKIAAFLEGDTLKWFDAKTQRELGSLEVFGGSGWATFSTNGRFIVVQGYAGGQIIDLDQKKIVGSVSGGNGYSFGYAFSKDNKFMAYTVGDRTTGGPYYYIDLWNLSTGASAFSGYDFFPTELTDRYHTMSAPAISPDTKLVAAGHSDKRVYVWDLSTGKTRFTLEGHGANVTCVDFSPNGRLLASGSLDGTVRLWNPSTGKLIHVITGFMNDVNDLQFSQNGQFLRVWTTSSTEVLVDLSSYQITQKPDVTPTIDAFELQQYQLGFSSHTSSIFGQVLFSPDGKMLALASQNISIWDVESEQLISFLDNVSGGTIRGMTFNADGSQIAAATSADQVIVWDTKTGTKLFSWTSSFLSGTTVFYGVGDSGLGPARGGGPIAEQGLAFSPEGDLLAFGNASTIAIWDLGGSGKIITLLNQAGQFATQVSFSQDGKRLYVIINRNRTAQVWDVNSAKLIKEVTLSDVDPNAFSAIAVRGPLFARNNSDSQEKGWIELWNLDEGKFITLASPSSDNEPLVFSPDGSLLVSENDGTLYFWDTQTGGLIYQTELKFNAGGLSISKDNNSIAVGNDGKATILNIQPILQLPRTSLPTPVNPQATPTPRILSWPTSTPLPTPKPSSEQGQTGTITQENAFSIVEKERFSQGTVNDIRWSSTGNSIFLSGSLGVSEYNVDANTKRISPTVYRGTEHWMYKTVTLPDGRTLATGSDAGNVYVIDVDTGRILVNQVGYGEPTLSPDGSMLVYLNADGILVVWNIEEGKQVISLGNDSRYPLHPIFSPDGQRVAAVQSIGSTIFYDDSIRVWNIKTGEIINALAGPDNNITGMNFSMDGKYVVAAAGGSAWVWSMVPGHPPEKFEIYPLDIHHNLNTYINTVTAAAISPDNRIVAIGTSEHSLHLYDRTTQKQIRDLEGHSSSIQELCFSPDGHLLISVDQDGRIILWDVLSGNYLTDLTEYSGPIKGLVYQQDENLTLWGEGTAWTLDPVNGQLLHTTRIGSGEILSASPRGDFLAVYSPYSVSLWDAQKGTFVEKLEGEAEEPFLEYYWEGLAVRRFYAGSFSSDGSHLVTAGSGGIWYYDLAQRRLMQQFEGSNAQKVVFGPDNRSVITSLYEQANPASVFDMQSGKMVFSLGQKYGRGGDYIQSVFSPNGQWIGTLRSVWDNPYELEVYDFLSKQFDRSMDLGKDIPPVSLAFNPSGSLIAIGFANGDIQLVDWKALQVLTTLKGHHEAVTQVIFSTDGRYLISGGADGTVRTWGLP